MRFWTSDWHIDHANIIDFTERPFYKTVTQNFALGDAEVEIPDTDAMNKALIDNTNDMVGVDDEIWFIGDVAMGSRKVSLPKFKQLKCRNLFLVPGNHDNCHPMFKPFQKAIPMYEDAGFTILEPQVDTMIGDTEVTVCHFPYRGDSQFEDRYSGNRPDDLGQWLIHGHVHSPHKTVPDIHPRQIHVGVDAWDMRPATEDQIAEIIAGE